MSPGFDPNGPVCVARGVRAKKGSENHTDPACKDQGWKERDKRKQQRHSHRLNSPQG